MNSNKSIYNSATSSFLDRGQWNLALEFLQDWRAGMIALTTNSLNLYICVGVSVVLK